MRGSLRVAAALTLMSLLAACGGNAHKATVPGSSPSATPSSSPSPVATGSAPTGAASPLTGVATPFVNTRPIVAVVVSGTTPLGLTDADVVIEEYSTPVRDLALFQSNQSHRVGPVTDTRPLDAKVLKVMKPIFAYNGGPAGMIKQVTNQGLFDASYRLHPQSYVNTGTALYAATSNLYALGTPSTAQSLFPFVQGDSPPPYGVRPIRQITITIPNQPTQVWAFDAASKAWRRVAGGPALSVATIALQNVSYKTVELVHGHGPFVPSAQPFGAGATFVTYGAGIVSGQWSKIGAERETVYADAKGVPVRFMRGKSFIGLLPPGSTVRSR